MLASLKRRATKLCDGLNRLEGVTCAPSFPVVARRLTSARNCLSGAVTHVACNPVRRTNTRTASMRGIVHHKPARTTSASRRPVLTYQKSVQAATARARCTLSRGSTCRTRCTRRRRRRARRPTCSTAPSSSRAPASSPSPARASSSRRGLPLLRCNGNQNQNPRDFRESNTRVEKCRQTSGWLWYSCCLRRSLAEHGCALRLAKCAMRSNLCTQSDASAIVQSSTQSHVQEGTFHMRLTILPPEEDMDSVIERLGGFHKKFMAKYNPK